MVETVLARDKNWVRWKIEGCHTIKRDPVSSASFIEAKSTAQKTATSKRLRPVPMGAVPLDFLRSESGDAAMEKLKAPDRYQLPELDSFKRKIADDDFEIEMSKDEVKAAAIAGKASKSWRALRIAARTKLAAFDKIDDPKKIDVVFEELKEDDDGDDADEPVANEEDMPTNREPIVISGPLGVGKTALVQKLMEARKGVFAIVVRHTTREPEEGEAKGKSFHFVKSQEFNQLRDGDRLVEYGTRDGVDYGTSTKAVDAVTEIGKVPIIELDLEVSNCPSSSCIRSLTSPIGRTIRQRHGLPSSIHPRQTTNPRSPRRAPQVHRQRISLGRDPQDSRQRPRRDKDRRGLQPHNHKR